MAEGPDAPASTRSLDATALRKVIDTLPRAVVVTDGTGVISLWNALAEALYGWTEAEVQGRSILDVLGPPDALEEMDLALRAALGGTPYSGERTVVRRDGTTVQVFVVTQPSLDDAGKVAMVIGASEDIGHLRALEQEARSLQQERERLIHETMASEERERVQRQRLELVAAVNEALEGSDDLAELMRAVTSVVVPRLGDWCSMYVLPAEHATVPLVEVSHVDPDMVAYARELQARYPYDPDAPTGIAAVIRTGTPQFFPEITSDVLDDQDLSADRRDIVRALALRSSIAVPLRKRGRVMGAMQFVMTEGQRRYTEEDLALAEAVATRIAATLDNRRLRQQRDRTARIDARLADVGRRLAAAHDIDEVVGVVVSDIPGVIGADSVRIGFTIDAEHVELVGDGTLPHRPDAPTEVIELSEPSPVTEAVRRVEVIVDQGTVGATVASPLLDDELRAIGVLVFGWSHPQTFDQIDHTAIETVSRLVGQTIRRAQTARHTEQLAAIASAMAAARTSKELAEILRDHGTGALGAAVANLRLLDGDSSTLQAIVPSNVPAEVLDRYQRIHIDDDLPISDAVRNHTTVWLPDLDTYAQRYPKAAADARLAGLGASAAVPLHTSDGAVIGVVTFAWPAAVVFDEPYRTRLTALCDLAAQTLERARLYESEHAVVTSMQRQLLTPLPHVAGLELAAFYEPATAAVGMGGDWYEAVVLNDGSLVAVIGDVVGHGIAAIAAMARIQHLLTGLLRAGTPLDEVFVRANAMLMTPEPIYATAVLLHVDHRQERLGYLTAGHPWALVRRPDGSVEALTLRQHALLGTPLTPKRLEYVDLPTGSLVLAYTDGLIERRDETITDSMGRLADCLSDTTVTAPLADSLTDLVARVRASGDNRSATTDDSAAILIHTTGAPSSATRLQLVVPTGVPAGQRD
ncbi:MAG: hypothetical protein JWM47_1877 [Acidimicrobiales bacterium]|nr:hypothetical protein [Acidimicrobiales bacterium]